MQSNASSLTKGSHLRLKNQIKRDLLLFVKSDVDSGSWQPNLLKM